MFIKIGFLKVGISAHPGTLKLITRVLITTGILQDTSLIVLIVSLFSDYCTGANFTAAILKSVSLP